MLFRSAQWIEDYAAAAAKHLAQMEAQSAGKERPEYRRLAIDIAIQCGLGRFFGAKFRSGVLYRIYEKTGDRAALEESLTAYRGARAAWAELAGHGKVYMSDITVGEHPQLRGHWLDRLPAMDKDIAAMAQKLEQAQSGAPRDGVAAAIQAALAHTRRGAAPCRHVTPAHFSPGKELEIALAVDKKADSAILYYRHVTQAERWVTAVMAARGNGYHATIPGTYSDSPYPLEYYFELKLTPGEATLYPGFGADLTNQPYFVLRRG